MTNRSRVLFVAQFPPPIHGSAIISKIIADSKAMNESFDIERVPLQFAQTMQDLGAFSLNKIGRMIRVAFQLNSSICRFRPHLVYFTLSPKGFSFYRDVLYAIILKLHRSKIIYHLHVKGLKEEAARNFIKRALYRFVFKNTYVITLSQYLLDDLVGIYNGTPFIVNNGVRAVSGAKRPLKRSHDGKIQLLFLSNLMRAKGIFVFLEAMLWLRKENAPFTARIIGNPGDVTREEVEAYIRDNGLTDIIVLDGGKYGEDKYAALKSADIFIHPTLNDAFPLVILEAMQFQLPVVSTYEGAIPEMIVEGVTGFLVPQNDSLMLAKKTLRLIQNREERVTMGIAAGQRFLTNYTTDNMENRLKEAFLTVMEREHLNIRKSET